jgi:hypothetical protein
MVRPRPTASLVLLLLAIALALPGWRPLNAAKNNRAVFVFPGVKGPLEASSVAAPLPARWQDFDQGEPSRLAILLTDPDSAWLGLVHGLQSLGLPFRITRDVQQALRHKVVLVYPTISGKVLSAEALVALARFPAQGGTLIGSEVEGGGMDEVFGYQRTEPSRARRSLVLNTEHPLNKAFTDPLEQTVPFSNPDPASNPAGSLGYIGAGNALARFDDGSAAITARDIGSGHAYALGVDLGFFLLTGYNNREQGVARAYANAFEPALDVVLRLLRAIYEQGEPSAVSLHSVPQGRDLTVLITHDIDYPASMINSRAYADYEASQGLQATYFIQTKYVRDWNDKLFFDKAVVAQLQHLRDLGMEVASHSVAHSRVFNRLALGSGDERYPDYQPFVFDAQRTDGASVLGELRVSRFLLERFLPGYRVSSFRPGHLSLPYSLPQALEASGYRYSSSATANNSLTHLPFRLTHGRETTAQSGVWEFPVTVEDEAAPPMLQRLPQALALAEQIARYGGLFVLLIHTNVVGDKLEFERGFVQGVRERAWFGTLRDFGEFWVARERVALDVLREDGAALLRLNAPRRVLGLSLRLPQGSRVTAAAPAALRYRQVGDLLVLDELMGEAQFRLAPSLLSPGLLAPGS